MNRVSLMGRLTADPELKTTQSGISAVSFRVAVDRDYADGNGKREADFINCAAWRKTAEHIHKWWRKGKPIIVHGNLRTRNYEDKNGVKRYVTEVVAASVEFVLSDKAAQGGGYQDSFAQPSEPEQMSADWGADDGFTPYSEGDLPF